MDRRKAHLDALPAAQLREDLDALKRCFYVFNANAKELATHVAAFVMSLQIAGETSDGYMDELVRRLHNYLTSVTSLIDSQRVVMRHRWPQKGSKVTTEICDSCGRPMPTDDGRSEFERTDYAEKMAETFQTGEAVFMSKLRNYCTHYSIPLPELSTTIKWEQGMPSIQQINTLQLQRDKLLRWGGWTGPAKTYLQQQEENFDLAPIVERYVNAAGQFAAWFWAEINQRSAVLIDEITSKATELNYWYQENVGIPDWLENGDSNPPPGWNGRLWRAGQRRDRYRHGTRGFRIWEIGGDGVIVLVKDDDWTPLPR
ncbi:hypothetical protein BVU76_17440 [Mycolicibacterium porcinum]|nr:hypothetical protein BVU76_17440 [Mycolicibacterium porcinum]